MSTSNNFYESGRRARDAGIAREDCPFRHGSAAYTGWVAGWKHRDAELALLDPAIAQAAGVW